MIYVNGIAIVPRDNSATSEKSAIVNILGNIMPQLACVDTP